MDTWASLRQEFWTAEQDWTVTVATLNGRISTVQYWKNGIPGEPAKLSTVATLAGQLLLKSLPDDATDLTCSATNDAQRWWRYLSHDRCATKPGPRDSYMESSDGSHAWLTCSIVGANFESSMACKLLAVTEKVAPAAGIEKQEVHDGLHEPNLLVWNGTQRTLQRLAFNLLKLLWSQKPVLAESAVNSLWGVNSDKIVRNLKDPITKANTALLEVGFPASIGSTNGFIQLK